MSRPRTNRVAETNAFLYKLERSVPELLAERVRMLRLIREQPDVPLHVIAGQCGASSATIERWWGSYCNGGLKSLLEMKQRGGNRRRSLSNEAIVELRQLIGDGLLSGPADVQHWILERHELEYSATGVRELLHALGISRFLHTGRDPNSTPCQCQQSGQGNHGRNGDRFVKSTNDSNAFDDLDDLVSVLVRLPTQCDLTHCADELRKSLRLILGDVDRISIDINTSCDLLRPHDYRPDLLVTQSVIAGQPESELEVAGAISHGAMATHLLERFRAQGGSLDPFHPPVWREYYYEGFAYLGTLFLWRERAQPAISDRTLSRLDLLEPFVVFLLSDIVTRHHYAHPLERVFNEVVATLSRECGLSLQERKILVLRLHGKTYKEIADQMNIAINTVAKHTTSTLRKTQTSSTIDLFAKYFAPRMVGARKPR